MCGLVSAYNNNKRRQGINDSSYFPLKALYARKKLIPPTSLYLPPPPHSTPSVTTAGERLHTLTQVYFFPPPLTPIPLRDNLQQSYLPYNKPVSFQWGAADTEIKVPFVENSDLRGFPFVAWSRSAYSYTCYTYWQGLPPC